MDCLDFKKFDKVNFQIISYMSIKCEIVQIDCDKGKFTYWLKSLENKYPYSTGEYFITDNYLQLTITKMERQNQDKGWQVAETEKPAFIWFHKVSLIDKLFKKQIADTQELKSKKESLKRFEPGFHFELK